MVSSGRRKGVECVAISISAIDTGTIGEFHTNGR